MARAMVLAAGLGTRLKPLTDELPKPLVPLGDRPVLAHIAERLRRHGFEEFVLNTHHGAGEFASRVELLGMVVHLSHEPIIRGTAGGIASARGRLAAPLIAWNGDILADPPIEALLARAGPGGLAFSVAPRPRGSGTVGLDGRGDITRLRGETFGVEVCGGDYIGVAALGARALAELPEQGCLIGDYALPALRRGGSVAAVLLRGSWTDVGSIASYHAANLAWLEQRHGAEGSWVHPGAAVGAAVILRCSVVGEGARVEGTGLLERCVVWPGARAVAPLRDAIVTTAGRVVVAA
jgi:mannose-1-phosphate guanylyltransferase